MPKLTNSKLPKYCRLSERNLGFYWRDGMRIYLPGQYGSPESLKAYNEKMASLLEERVDEVAEKLLQTATPRIPKDITVLEFFVRFLEHAKKYYVKSLASHHTSNKNNWLGLQQLLKSVKSFKKSVENGSLSNIVTLNICRISYAE